MKLSSLFHADPEQDVAEPAAPPLEPIRLLFPDAQLSGWVQPNGERVTDMLQHGGPLRFLPAGARPDAWELMEPADLQVVVPPPHVSLPERRVHRQRHEVFVRIGSYVVTGTAHLLPGEENDPYLRASRQYLPITDAILSVEGYTPEVLETVIVNLKRVDEFEVI
ncbi:MAG: hypothetical protein ACRDGV_06590 [Candidatus Limnocylindria bacterium]